MKQYEVRVGGKVVGVYEDRDGYRGSYKDIYGFRYRDRNRYVYIYMDI